MSQNWASTFSICRPSIRSGACAQGLTTRWSRSPTTRAALGPSVPAKGSHCAIHPALGTLEDFTRLIELAKERGIAIALDIAFQCAPDHPYVADLEWFRFRPDGTVQYAENPPKKYQGHLSLRLRNRRLGSAARRADPCRGVLDRWACGWLRVDNPHTKPFGLWEQMIARFKAEHPELIFLSEAFTRPKVMHRLAKVGFSPILHLLRGATRRHSEEYFTELCHGPDREYFRPNVWPNTPDILPEYLQIGVRPRS